MHREESDLFELEKQIAQKAEDISGNEEYAENPLFEEYKTLAKNYKKLYRQSEKLVKISDHQQDTLNIAKKEIEKLSEISKQISTSLEFDEVFKKITEYLNQTFHFEAYSLSLVQPDKKTYRIEKFLGPDFLSSIIEKYLGAEYPISDEGREIARCISNNELIFLDHANIFQTKNKSPNEPDVMSALFLPISIDDEVIGAFCLTNYSKELKLTKDVLDTIERFATHIAVVVKNSKLYEDTEKARLRIIKENYEYLKSLNRAYVRFIPRQFLKLLKKRDIIDVNMGDHLQTEMTVLFSDIRSFTSLSETMTPQENFNFINSYLGQIGPVIRQNNGFIDKYIGDAIMALFPTSADEALSAAVQMQREVGVLNIKRESQGYELLQIGIGMHFGKLMLGIIGETERLEGTVISDAVNLASRIEGLTKYFGAKILISADTYYHLSKPEDYLIRFVGHVIVKGKSKSVMMYEVFDSDSDDIKEMKLATRDQFQEAWTAYVTQDFPVALELFQRCISINPNDLATLRYIKQCEKFLIMGMPEDDWDGAIQLDFK